MSKHKENEKCANCNNTSTNYSVFCGPCEQSESDFRSTLEQIYELELASLSLNDANDLKRLLHRLLHHASGRKQ